MARVRDILAGKGSHVHALPATTTVLDATVYMNEHRIGALVVTGETGMVGMFTERDVLRRVVAEQRPPADVRIADVMTSDIICIAPETDIDDASRIMKDRRIRHLPVNDADGRLLGLISIGDINAYHASDQETTIHYLNDYIQGRV